jgi:hypothetical protein
MDCGYRFESQELTSRLDPCGKVIALSPYFLQQLMIGINNQRLGDSGMKCSKCGRDSGLLRRKCPACKIPFVRLYLLVVIVLIVIGMGGLALLGKLSWPAS